MSLVLHYKLNATDSADIGKDSVSGSNTAVNGGVYTTSDATYGNVAFFDGDTANLLIENIPTLVGDSSRTYSCWVSFQTLGSNITLLSMDTGSTWTWVSGVNTNPRFYQHIQNGAQIVHTDLLSTNTWYHFVTAYDSTTSTNQIYVNGVLGPSGTGTIGASNDHLSVGNINYSNANTFFGKMVDLRIYDDVLSAADISTLFSDGPNPTTVTPWSTLVQIAWQAVSGATSYRITYDNTDSYFPTETATIYNLEPLTLYTFHLFSSTDNENFVFIEQISVTTLSDTPENSNMEIFLSEGSYDLTDLDDTTRERLQKHLNDVLNTGDKVLVSTGSLKNAKLNVVINGNTSTIPDGESILFTFEPTLGNSQAATLQLSDSSTVGVTYDEINNHIIVDGVTYAHSDSFVLDGKKATVYDI